MIYFDTLLLISQEFVQTGTLFKSDWSLPEFNQSASYLTVFFCARIVELKKFW